MGSLSSPGRWAYAQQIKMGADVCEAQTKAALRVKLKQALPTVQTALSFPLNETVYAEALDMTINLYRN